MSEEIKQKASWELTKEQRFELRLAYRKWEFDANPSIGESIDWWFKEIDSLLSQALQKRDEDLRRQINENTSDGFHTFKELYEYRLLYNAGMFNSIKDDRGVEVFKSKKHNDGEDCFGGGWFIVMANLPTGQISNHYELKDWDLFQIPEYVVADKWDGHTPQDVADRLRKFLLNNTTK